ncbi:MAG: DNA primase [Acidobacteria bacterium]|nr:DNA primase [Acidobacteriota bacterium]NIQ30640.1 DNA primase [Acidobacteriota bacterium]NIQ85598.1 DNA primase [Acidobacteriota bacterium]
MGGPFAPDFIEAVRASGDIVQVISDYVPLKRAGRRLKGLCPFHQEKTPSFSVDPESQLFYCFGCQTGGDIFKFVQLYDKLNFGEAVEALATRFGVPLPAVRQKGGDDRERVLEINGLAQSFFKKLLAADAGRGCRDYLAERGLDETTIERLGLGYAADDWEALRGHLVAKRARPADIVKAGLAMPRKSGSGEYDRFRDRLIFPIRDIQGRVVAFGGRALAADAQPKYINSPETPAYTKGNHLYGLDLAKEAIRREGFAIVVEGYMDLAALLQAGFDNVVASLGTAFTPAQARLLARYTTRVRVSYDGDAAGAQATARSLDMLLEQGFEVHVVELPGGTDPDDTIRDQGAAEYGRLVREAPEYLEFLVRRQIAEHGMADTRAKVAAVNAVLPHVAKLTNAIERMSWATRLADTLQIEDELVLQELKTALKTARSEVRQRPATSAEKLRDAEVRLVHLLMRSEDGRRRLVESIDETDLAATHIAPIVAVILDLTRRKERVDASSVLEQLSDKDAQLLTRILFRDEPQEGPTIEDCLATFQRDRIIREERQAIRELGRESKTDDASSDSEELDRRLMHVQQLARQRDALL